MNTNANTNSNTNFNTNDNNTNTTKDKTITKTEKFLVVTEDQDLGSNNVTIDNLTQVKFVACGRDQNNNNKIVIADSNIDWKNGPLSLQDIFDTKLNNSGIIGTVVPGIIPVQGIILSDAAGNSLVKIGANIPFGSPKTATTISNNAIQFGGVNNDREINSAQISIDVHERNSLCIVGMSTGKNVQTRKINMWAEGGCTLNGRLTVSGAGSFGTLSVTGDGTIGSLSVTGAGSFGGALTVTGPGTIRGDLTVNGSIKGALTFDGTANFKGQTNFTTQTNFNQGLNALNVNHTIRGVAGNNLHIASKQNLYLMSPTNTIIYKCTSDCSTWESSSGHLTVQGDLRVDGSLSFLVRGCIIMYHGTIAPPGWAICNGQSGTPDLRAKFVIGISPAYVHGRIGGLERVILTKGEMPSHNHNPNGNPGYLSANACGNEPASSPAGGVTQNTNSWHKSCPRDLITEGSNESHENMPPYYALLYIMKL